MEKLESAVGAATAALLTITKLTDEFTSTDGLGLVDTRGLALMLGGVVTALNELKESQGKKRRNRTPSKVEKSVEAPVAKPVEVAKAEKAEDDFDDEPAVVSPATMAPAKNKGGRPKGAVVKAKAPAPVAENRESLFD